MEEVRVKILGMRSLEAREVAMFCVRQTAIAERPYRVFDGY